MRPYTDWELKTLHARSSKEFRDALLDFLWRRWGQLGIHVAGTAPPVAQEQRTTCGIDPEALAIATLLIARREPRMFDAVCGWLAQNRALLSTQRLNNLAERFPSPASPLMVAVAEATGSRPARRDRNVHVNSAADLEPLFPDLPSASLRGELEPHFAAHGFARPPILLQGKTSPPDLETLPCLNLRLRAIFGPGSRAEVVHHLIAHHGEPRVTSEIARAAAYDRRNVLDVLTHLHLAGMVTRRAIRGDLMWAIDRSRWFPWLGLDGHPVGYLDWQSLLLGLVLIWDHLEEAERQPASTYVQASRAREVMDTAAPLLQAAPGWSRTDPRVHKGAAYLEAFEADLLGLTDTLAGL